MTLAPLASAGPLVQAHTLAATLAIVLGSAQFILSKGGRRHRWLGRAWVLLLALAALTSLGIHGIRAFGSLSWIHGLSVLTLIVLFAGVRHARAGRIEAHRWTMVGLFVGALLITGLFTLVPGRLMHAVLFDAVDQNDARTPPNTARPTPG